MGGARARGRGGPRLDRRSSAGGGGPGRAVGGHPPPGGDACGTQWAPCEQTQVCRRDPWKARPLPAALPRCTAGDDATSETGRLCAANSAAFHSREPLLRARPGPTQGVTQPRGDSPANRLLTVNTASGASPRVRPGARARRTGEAALGEGARVRAGTRQRKPRAAASTAGRRRRIESLGPCTCVRDPKKLAPGFGWLSSGHRGHRGVNPRWKTPPHPPQPLSSSAFQIKK